MTKARRFPAVIESIFDVSYLLFALFAGGYLLATGGGNPTRALYGALALTLGCGDAFHLLPRTYGQLRDKMEDCRAALGFGKLVTSLTMTLFYLLLYLIWTRLYAMPVKSAQSAVLLALAVLRIALCLFPQNRWFSQNPPLRWAIYRNLPFLLIGILLLAAFAKTAGAAGDPFRFMPLAIAASFLFYLPVVLFSGKYPAVGALMLPKTLAYVWMLCMGFSLPR